MQITISSSRSSKPATLTQKVQDAIAKDVISSVPTNPEGYNLKLRTKVVMVLDSTGGDRADSFDFFIDIVDGSVTPLTFTDLKRNMKNAGLRLVANPSVNFHKGSGTLIIPIRKEDIVTKTKQ